MADMDIFEPMYFSDEEAEMEEGKVTCQHHPWGPGLHLCPSSLPSASII